VRATLAKLRERFAQRPVLRFCLRKLFRSRIVGAIWWRSIRMLFGLRFEDLENVPARRPLIFVANHGSHYDGLFAKTAVSQVLGREVTAVAWGGIRGFPFAHHAIEAGAFSLILTEEHGDTTDDRAAVLEQMIKRLRRGESLFLMGEGMPGRALAKFKDGAAYAALQTGTLIVPMTLRGIQPLWQDLPWPKRWHGKVSIHFHPPVDPADYRTLSWREAVDAVTAEVRRRVASAIDYPDALAATSAPTWPADSPPIK
jgi:1-acyl-sn-glycerol-3-phosphate acyltransferase